MRRLPCAAVASAPRPSPRSGPASSPPPPAAPSDRRRRGASVVVGDRGNGAPGGRCRGRLGQGPPGQQRSVEHLTVLGHEAQLPDPGEANQGVADALLGPGSDRGGPDLVDDDDGLGAGARTRLLATPATPPPP